jgi:hypothetical protein
MAAALDLRLQTGPIRIRVSALSPITLRLATAPVSVRLLGLPGPDGLRGPQGAQGNQGEPGVTILPTDAPINGGFF